MSKKSIIDIFLFVILVYNLSCGKLVFDSNKKKLQKYLTETARQVYFRLGIRIFKNKRNGEKQVRLYNESSYFKVRKSVV